MEHMTDRGRAYLHSREGKVLRAYRCPAGKWTIGAGLTAASGVVKPKAGMTITEAEADRLLELALFQNYEPSVRAALGEAPAHAFDGAVSFHFNTGAIARASWVRSYVAGDRRVVREQLGRWRKGGGKVLPGLVRRRNEEADIILADRWPRDLDIADDRSAPDRIFARFVVSVTASEIVEIRAAFRQLGHDPGPAAGKVMVAAVEAFQRGHDLAVDGLIGRATLSALQREVDARRGAATAGGAGVGGGGVATVNEAVPAGPGGDAVVTWVGLGTVAVSVLVLAWLAWRYRDVVAARIDNRAPGLAAWLRSF
jgi:lysozyme